MLTRPMPTSDNRPQLLIDTSVAVALAVAGTSTIRPPGRPSATQLLSWAHAHDLDIDPATALRAVLLWSRLHGFVSLEIAGSYASMGIDPDPVFEIQLATLAA
jgi:hypothetical protein